MIKVGHLDTGFTHLIDAEMEQRGGQPPAPEPLPDQDGEIVAFLWAQVHVEQERLARAFPESVAVFTSIAARRFPVLLHDAAVAIFPFPALHGCGQAGEIGREPRYSSVPAILNGHSPGQCGRVERG